jgi:Fe-S-cluster containining protein
MFRILLVWLLIPGAAQPMMGGKGGILIFKVIYVNSFAVKMQVRNYIMEAVKGVFKCQRCGTCCRWSGHVLLTDADIGRLALLAGITEEQFIERYTVLAANRSQLSLADGPDGSCALLKDGFCTLYEARPAQCRDFPHGWRVAEGCPALAALNETGAV